MYENWVNYCFSSLHPSLSFLLFFPLFILLSHSLTFPQNSFHHSKPFLCTLIKKKKRRWIQINDSVIRLALQVSSFLFPSWFFSSHPDSSLPILILFFPSWFFSSHPDSSLPILILLFPSWFFSSHPDSSLPALVLFFLYVICFEVWSRSRTLPRCFFLTSIYSWLSLYLHNNLQNKRVRDRRMKWLRKRERERERKKKERGRENRKNRMVNISTIWLSVPFLSLSRWIVLISFVCFKLESFCIVHAIFLVLYRSCDFSRSVSFMRFFSFCIVHAIFSHSVCFLMSIHSDQFHSFSSCIDKHRKELVQTWAVFVGYRMNEWIKSVMAVNDTSFFFPFSLWVFSWRGMKEREWERKKKNVLFRNMIWFFFFWKEINGYDSQWNLNPFSVLVLIWIESLLMHFISFSDSLNNWKKIFLA